MKSVKKFAKYAKKGQKCEKVWNANAMQNGIRICIASQYCNKNFSHFHIFLHRICIALPSLSKEILASFHSSIVEQCSSWVFAWARWCQTAKRSSSVFKQKQTKFGMVLLEAESWNYRFKGELSEKKIKLRHDLKPCLPVSKLKV